MTNEGQGTAATRRVPRGGAVKRVLVADLAQGVATIRNVLGSETEIVDAGTLAAAAVTLSAGVDLVTCGIHFDDSRMFDLLRLAKATETTREVPFVCFRDMDSELSQPLLQSLQIACSALGAAAFVDLHELKRRFGVDEADQRFRRILVGCWEDREGIS